MKKPKLNGLEVFTLLFLIASSIYLSAKYYFEDLAKKSAKYQEINITSNNSFTICIKGNEYIFWVVKNHLNKTLELTPDAKMIKCTVDEVSYSETQLPINVNKDYIINANY